MVVWHKLESQSKIADACLSNPVKSPYVFTVAGCYKFKDGVCHIYTQDGKEHMEELGHELKHCFDGHFHDHNGEW